MKNLLIIGGILVLAGVIAWQYSKSKEDKNAVMVVFNVVDKQYHTDSCKANMTGGMTIKLTEVKKSGGTPCPVCKPPE